jgi:hypothetical protein
MRDGRSFMVVQVAYRAMWALVWASLFGLIGWTSWIALSISLALALGCAAWTLRRRWVVLVPSGTSARRATLR